MKTFIKFTTFIVLLFLGLSLLDSCKKESAKNNGTTESNSGNESSEAKISHHNGNKSHNMGQACMNCHKQGGSGESIFNVAATVYDTTMNSVFPNTTVRLYTGANGSGTLKYTIEVDAKGNFYTTESIDFTNGLYPAVTGTQGTKYMSSSITTGNCASCHGNTTNKIWTK